MRFTVTYRKWISMKQRCNDPNHPSYKFYKDVGYDPSWETFENFYNDLGECPDEALTLERKDSSKAYAPDNCYWGTTTQQNRNKSDTKIRSFEKAEEIREKHASGNYTNAELALEYNCSSTAISQVINYQSYAEEE